MINIRNFNKEDYLMIKQWWDYSGEVCPPISAMPEDSTFILEVNNTPIYSLTLLTTNTKEIAFLEYFVGNPEHKNSRKEYTHKIINYVTTLAKNLGYKRTLILSYRDKVKNRYKELGFSPTVSNLTCFCKEF